MPAHGMADAYGAAQIEEGGDLRDVLAKATPWVGRIGFRAAAVSAEVDGDRAVAWQAADHGIPTARVKTRGVRKEQRRIFARPLPNGDVVPADGQDFENRFGQTKL